MPLRKNALIVTGLLALGLAAPVTTGASAAPAPAADAAGEYRPVYPIGNARRLANGLYEVKSKNGDTYTTHGADAAITPATQPTFTPAEYPPVCATTQRTFVFYMSPSDKTYRYDTTMIGRLRTYTRQVTGFIRSEGLASSANTKGPRLKVACNADGSIRVGGLRSTTTSAQDSFDTIKNDLIKAGFNDANTKYLVFYDDPAVGKCGLGDLSQDDSKSTANLNNNGAKYAVVYGNATGQTCWTWNIALHELFHTMGAVQNGAPGSSGAGHCNDGRDTMCYGDDGPTSKYTETSCGTTKLDCNYNTYYDTVTESGEWLSTHWNLGWSGNSYLQF